jgi:hypothetical protein
MTDNIQPPEGYTSEPPKEPGWYKVWDESWGDPPFRIVRVFWSSGYKCLWVYREGRLSDVKYFRWHPAKIEFP